MNDETIAKYRMKLPIQLDIPEDQLNAREFIRLIKKHKLQVTKAVGTHLASACRYRNLINGLNKESYIKKIGRASCRERV